MGGHPLTWCRRGLEGGDELHPVWGLTLGLVAGGAGGTGSSGPQEACTVYLLSTSGVPFSVIDLPLVTKSCYSGCPDISTLSLGPHVSMGVSTELQHELKFSLNALLY